MNLCLDCNSTYAKPGTCNCFAPGGKREPKSTGGNTDTITIRPAPYTPSETSPWVPYTPGTIRWGTSHSFQCPNCGGFYTDSHFCGYWNPHYAPVTCGVLVPPC